MHGTRLATRTQSRVELWDLTAPAPSRSWPKLKAIEALAVSSETAVSFDSESVVVQWGVSAPDTWRDIGGDGVSCVGVSPDGGWIVLGFEFGGGEIRRAVGEGRWTIPAPVHEGDPEPLGSVAVAIANDGRAIISDATGRTEVYARAGNGRDAQVVAKLPKTDRVQALSVCGRGFVIAYECGELVIWDPDLAESKSVHKVQEIRALAVSDDGRFALIRDKDDRVLRVRLRDGDSVEIVHGGAAPDALALSPDGSHCAIAHSGSTPRLSLWRIRKEQPISTLFLEMRATTMAWTGNTLVLGDVNGGISVFEVTL